MKTSLLFSILCCLPFLIFTQKDIVQLEYFLNSDPGIGMATQVSISPTDSLVQSFTADISALSQGAHYLYTRTKDELC